MQYKLLVLDIDGTIVKEHTNVLSPVVVSAVKKASKKVHISLVSARAWEDQELIVDTLGLRKFYHVAENGTKVINSEGTLEYNKHIPAEEVQQIVDVTSQLFDDVGFCIDSRWRPEYQNPEKEIVSVVSLSSHFRQKADKIPAALQRLQKAYTVSVGRHWTDPTWAVTLISHKDASKGKGLRYIQGKLGIKPEETIVVGDGASDISSFDFAGVKVAMGNAEEELQSIATYIAPSVSQNGVVDVINKFLSFS